MDKELTFYTKEQESKDDGRSYKDVEVENNVLVFFDNAENTGSIEWDRTLENGITYDRVIFDFQFKRQDDDPNSYVLTFAQSHDLSELYAFKEFRDWMKSEHLANTDHWSITEPEPDEPKGPTTVIVVSLLEEDGSFTLSFDTPGHGFEIGNISQWDVDREPLNHSERAKGHRVIVDLVKALQTVKEIYFIKS